MLDDKIRTLESQIKQKDNEYKELQGKYVALQKSSGVKTKTKLSKQPKTGDLNKFLSNNKKKRKKQEKANVRIKRMMSK